MKRHNIYELIDAERASQDTKVLGKDVPWNCASPIVRDEPKLVVLVEETGEVATAILEDEDKGALIAELVQVAAVAVAWLESIELHRTEEHNVQGDQQGL